MARREYQRPNVLRESGHTPYWYIRYRVRVFNDAKGKFERKEKWHRLGECETMTKRQAERERDRLMPEINNQVLTLREHIPFKDFVSLYKRDFMPNLGTATQGKYTSILNTHLLPAFKGLSLAAVETQRIQAFLTQKKAEDVSWWARSDMRNLLSGIFTVAATWKYWTKPNPVIGTDIGEKEWKRDNRPLSDDEVQAIITALDGDLRLIVETFVVTGMRTSEVFGLKWKYVDLRRGVILVRERNYRGDQGVPKSRKSKRDLPLQHLIEPYQARQGGPDDFVFHNNGEPLDERSVLKYQLRPVVKRLGLHFEGFGWHTFRRTHLTVFSEVGATAFETQDQAGHAKLETTMNYIRPSMERRNAALTKLTSRLIPAPIAGIQRGSKRHEAA